MLLRALRLAVKAICIISISPFWALAQKKDSLRSYHTKPFELAITQLPENLSTQELGNNALHQRVLFSVADAIRQFSGVNLRDYGGLGGLKTVDFRGFGAGHTKILVNGIPQSSGQSGQIDLGLYPVQFLSGVQMSQGGALKRQGPAFASELLETVSINLKTNPQDSLLQVRSSFGSFGFYQMGGQIPVRIGNRKVMIQLTGVHSLGAYPFKVENGSVSVEQMRQNAKLKQYGTQITGSGKAKLWEYDWNIRANHSQRGLPGATILYNAYAADQLLNEDWIGQTEWRRYFTSFPVQMKWATRVGVSSLIYSGSNWSGSFKDNYTMPEAWTGIGLSGLLPGELSWKASVELQANALKSNTINIGNPKRTQSSGVVELKKTLSIFQLRAYSGYTFFNDNDYNRERGLTSALIPVGGLSAIVGNSNWSFETSWRKTTRLPSFNDLYFVRVGNINLKPEVAQQFRLDGFGFFRPTDGFIIKLRPGYWVGSAENKILALPAANVYAWSMQNVGKVFLQGWECSLESELNLGGGNIVSLTGNITRQWALNRSEAQLHLRNHQLPYVTPWQANTVLAYSAGLWQAAISGQFLGRRYLPGENSIENSLNALTLTDVSLKRKLSLGKSAGAVSIEIMNIFNRQYEIIKSFPMPGIQGRLNLIWYVKT